MYELYWNGILLATGSAIAVLTALASQIHEDRIDLESIGYDLNHYGGWEWSDCGVEYAIYYA